MIEFVLKPHMTNDDDLALCNDAPLRSAVLAAVARARATLVPPRAGHWMTWRADNAPRVHLVQLATHARQLFVVYAGDAVYTARDVACFVRGTVGAPDAQYPAVVLAGHLLKNESRVTLLADDLLVCHVDLGGRPLANRAGELAALFTPAGAHGVTFQHLAPNPGDTRPAFLRPRPFSLLLARYMSPELFATLREPCVTPPDLRDALRGHRGDVRAVSVPR